jgi:ribosome-binding ATPase YchF (GTP1/OBG family)
MKIAYTGVDLQEGKVKYIDDKLNALEKKVEPQKVSPYYAEFIGNDFIQADVIVIPRDNLLDLLILDIEKFEARLQRSTDEQEKKLAEKCIEKLEAETPLCEVVFDEEEKKIITVLAPLSFKPVVVLDETPEVNDIIRMSLEKSQTMFFYTAGKKEVHAWPVREGTDIVTCAGKIHSDLERGFIKGDVVSYEDFMQCHNFNDAKARGVAKVVDRDYIVNNSDVIEIRYNV